MFCVYQQMDYYDYRRTYRSTTVYLYLCKLSTVQHYMSKSGRKLITSCRFLILLVYVSVETSG